MAADKSKPKKKLSVRDEKFVDLVAKGRTATDAYIESGHSEKNARVSASKKLTNPNINSALEERKAYFRSIADVEAKDIIGAQQEIAFASIEDALDDSGFLDFTKAKENGSAKLIKKISRQQTKYGENVSVEFYSRTDALGQLADMLGLKQAPRLNETDVAFARIKSDIEKRAIEKNISFAEEAQNYLKNHADSTRPEIKEKLAETVPLIG